MSQAFIPITVNNSHNGYQIHRLSQFKPWSRKIFDDCLTPPYFAYYLMNSDEYLGYFIAMKVLDELTLMDIAVDIKFRSLGFGRVLLNYFMSEANKHEVSKVWLEVRQSNIAAIELYQSVGFNLVEIRRNYYPTSTGKENALIMCLELNIR